ncbi:CaiB/BaiF CoA transferase family protein [Dactylosporangium sp. CA-092794]|uniref:CaiB/BaiF CoA transferase family protein n=1 Tax=Dactylosporangium sp. CA-092794 TaxID=3239929 RepID=UPI003D90453B
MDDAGDRRPPAALDGCRVLELSHLAGAVAGKILADLGADVVKVEPRGGEPARWTEPAHTDSHGGRHGLEFLAFNGNKRSVTLDLAAEAGREILARLAGTADIVLLDWERIGDPGEADRLFELCARDNPKLVWCEIWPYGRGADETTLATELTLQAQGGHLYLNGEIDRPPVRVSAPVASVQSGAEAASAALMAHYHAVRTGVGQRVDVSVQECVVWTLLNTTMTWQCLGVDEVRGGSVKRERGNTFFTRLVWPCRDGFIQFGPVGGGGGAARETSYRTLVEWMRDEGFYAPILDAHDWNGEARFGVPQEAYDEVSEAIGAFIRTRTLDELIERGMKRRILLAPIYSIPQLLRAEQLLARNYFRPVEDPLRDATAVHPGPFAVMSRTPLVEPGPAPVAGAHTRALLSDAGLGAEEIEMLIAAEAV